MAGWKLNSKNNIYMKKRKKAKANKLIFTIVLLSFFIIIMAGFIRYLVLITKPTPVVGLFIFGQPSEIVIMDMTDKSGYRFKIDNDMIFNAAYNLGQYSVQDLYKLDKLENKSYSVLADTISNELGLPIIYYIMPDEPLKTNTSLFFRLFTLHKLRQIDESRVRSITIPKDEYCREVIYPDSSQKCVFDYGKFDSFIAANILSSKIRNEGLSITIKNLSKTEGAASILARQVRFLGVPTVITDNGMQSDIYCTIEADSEVSDSYTFYVISNIFKCSLIQNKPQDRSDITISIGGDYAKRYEVSSLSAD